MLDLSLMDSLTEFTYIENISDITQAQKWIDDCYSNLIIVIIEEKCFLRIIDSELTVTPTDKPFENLKKNKNFLISILHKTVYSEIIDCVECIETVIKNLENFDFVKNEVDDCMEITILEDILPSSLCLLFKIKWSHISLTTEKTLYPFFMALVEHVFGYSVQVVQVSNAETQKATTLYMCPFVIFEDSDCHSAVDAALKSWWKYDGKMQWTVTHIYIHESIFNKVVSLIKTESKKKFQCSNKGHSLVKELYEGKFEIFQPKEGFAHSMFIGWDPRDLLDIENMEFGVSVLPFRNDNEIVSIINSKITKFNINAASIWTEKFSRSNSISKRLNMSTIWVNCHGVFNTSLDVKLRLNLDNLTSPTTFFETKNTELQFICSNLKEAKENATKASLILKKLKTQTKGYFFKPDNIVLDDDTKRLVIVWKNKKPFITIIVRTIQKVAYDKLASIVLEALAHNCAVILQACDKSLPDINKYFGMFNLQDLPKGSLNIVKLGKNDNIAFNVLKKAFFTHRYPFYIEDVFEYKTVYYC